MIMTIIPEYENGVISLEKLHIYLGNDPYGFPIYVEENRILYNPNKIVENAKFLNIKPLEYLFYGILHELGHLFSNSIEFTELENEIQAWEYALALYQNIPIEMILISLNSYKNSL